MDVDLIFKIAAVGILVAVLNQLLVRSGREEQAMMTTLAGLVVVLMMVVQEIAQLFTMVKTLGIALVSRLGTEICRDAGQGAMAAVLETAGAFGAVLVSLPLVRAAWELLRSLV